MAEGLDVGTQDATSGAGVQVDLGSDVAGDAGHLVQRHDGTAACLQRNDAERRNGIERINEVRQLAGRDLVQRELAAAYG